ncbi:NUC188 domain-containing protein [Irpex rosettiformis]|uniref:NUC188 domain-containing protein n=1 Tax=Irpex rosettiformis TaxID=378272 RepID=A0ACB8U0Q3_9APHY|nr:NUC188 domain-containing protein [Irpex rosettiformis]
MSGKRKESPNDMPGREKKKQKTALARTIAVQPSSSGVKAVAGSSKTVQFENAKPLPESLDVEKFAEARAFEISAMHTAMENARASTTHRAWQQLPRHLRRRAASHDVRRVPLKLRDKARAEMDTPKVKPKKHIPQRGKARRVPRAQELLKRQRDKVWLESHLWHAKRMHMEDMWGYRLATTPTEKSFRPSHRASVHGSILHDASYLGLIEMKGPHHALQCILDRCSDCQAPSPAAKRFATGARACDTHIYKRDAYPLDLIAPAKVLWRPVSGSSSSSNIRNSTSASTGEHIPKKASGPRKKGKERESATVQPPEDQRTVWIWVHPSVFDEIFQELSICISLSLEAIKIANPSSHSTVEIADLRQHLNVFEIMGPKASQIIRGAFKPAFDDGRDEFKKCWAALADLQSTASVPRNTVIGFKVHDPRLSFPPKNATVSIGNPKDSGPSVPVMGFYPTSSLASSTIWDEDIRQPLLKPKYKKKDIDERRSKNLVPGTPLQSQKEDDRIPVLMIQHSVENSSSQTPGSPFSDSPSLHGWTLIIPAGWSMAFLPSLFHTGTRVGGQRERQTQSFESSRPFFPRDYPSTASYNKFVDERGDEERERWEKKPKAKRPSWEKLGVRSPWKPDWEVVLGLKEPSPFSEKASDENGDVEDLITADRSEDAMEVEVRAESFTCQPWLLRGLGITSLLTSMGSNSSENRVDALLSFVDNLRAKRSIPLLMAEASDVYDPPRVSPEDIYRSALVRIALRLVGRGCPSDMAIVYGMTDEEIVKSNQSKQDIEPVDIDEEDTQSIPIPPHETIAGYVTTGSFSLSLGEGSALGAIPLTKLIGLQLQAKRLMQTGVLVKVRNRHEVVCRTARVLVLED